MPDTFEFIESYFQQKLSNEEKVAFETRCESDEAFAKEVAMYVTTRQVLQEELLQQRQQQWREDFKLEETPIISIARKPIFKRYITYVAAACLLLAASVYLFEAQNSSQKFAAKYISANYSTISGTMDASRDSLQLGVGAYNDKRYDEALRLFLDVEQRDPSNSDAKKYAGLTYLQQKDYDQAIRQFDDLANMKLHSNPGDFLKAVVLLERNSPGDKDAAKTLLQKVISEKEENSEDAEELFKKF